VYWQVFGLAFRFLLSVVSLDQTKNQPTLKIQITGVTRPGNASGWFDYKNWRITAGIPWTDLDANVPSYTEANSSGKFDLELFAARLDDAGGTDLVDPPSRSILTSTQTGVHQKSCLCSNGKNWRPVPGDPLLRLLS